MRLVALDWMGLMSFLYTASAVTYATRIPERFFPGKCDIWVSKYIWIIYCERHDRQKTPFLYLVSWAAYQMCRSGRPDRPISKWNESIMPNWESCSRPNCSSLKSRVTLTTNSPHFGSTDTLNLRATWSAKNSLKCPAAFQLPEREGRTCHNYGGELLLTMLLWHGLY